GSGAGGAWQTGRSASSWSASPKTNPYGEPGRPWTMVGRGGFDPHLPRQERGALPLELPAPERPEPTRASGWTSDADRRNGRRVAGSSGRRSRMRTVAARFVL